MDAQWSDDFHHALFAVLEQRKARPVITLTSDHSLNLRKRLSGRLSMTASTRTSQSPTRAAGQAICLSIASLVSFRTMTRLAIAPSATASAKSPASDRAKIAASSRPAWAIYPYAFSRRGMGGHFAIPILCRSSGSGAGATGFRRPQATSSTHLDGIPASFPIPRTANHLMRSKLNWNELPEQVHADVFGWYRKLIKLRRSEPSLNNGEPGNTAVTFSEEQRWLCMQRGSIIVACNIAEKAQAVPIHGGGEMILASLKESVMAGDNITLPSDSVVVIRTIAER